MRSEILLFTQNRLLKGVGFQSDWLYFRQLTLFFFTQPQALLLWEWAAAIPPQVYPHDPAWFLRPFRGGGF